MTIWRPPLADQLGWLVGMEWPDGDEDKVWALADAWRAAGKSLTAINPDIDTAISATRSAYPTGDGGQAMITQLQNLRSGEGSLDELVNWFERTAGSADETGNEIEYTKLMFHSTLILLAAEIAAAWIFPPTAPAAEAAAVASTRVGVRLLVRRLITALGEKAGRLIGATVLRGMIRHFGLSIVLPVLQDLGIQSWQSVAGRRDGVDWGRVGVTALSSTVGAVTAMPLGIGAGALTSKLTRGLNERLGRTITAGVAGGVGGTAAGLSGWFASAAVTGNWDFDPRVLTSGALSGALPVSAGAARSHSAPHVGSAPVGDGSSPNPYAGNGSGPHTGAGGDPPVGHDVSVHSGDDTGAPQHTGTAGNGDGPNSAPVHPAASNEHAPTPTGDATPSNGEHRAGDPTTAGHPTGDGTQVGDHGGGGTERPISAHPDTTATVHNDQPIANTVVADGSSPAPTQHPEATGHPVGDLSGTVHPTPEPATTPLAESHNETPEPALPHTETTPTDNGQPTTPHTETPEPATPTPADNGQPTTPHTSTPDPANTPDAHHVPPTEPATVARPHEGVTDPTHPTSSREIPTATNEHRPPATVADSAATTHPSPARTPESAHPTTPHNTPEPRTATTPRQPETQAPHRDPATTLKPSTPKPPIDTRAGDPTRSAGLPTSHDRNSPVTARSTGTESATPRDGSAAESGHPSAKTESTHPDGRNTEPKPRPDTTPDRPGRDHDPSRPTRADNREPQRQSPHRDPQPAPRTPRDAGAPLDRNADPVGQQKDSPTDRTPTPKREQAPDTHPTDRTQAHEALAKHERMGSGAMRGDDPTPETIHHGTVRMEDHPDFASLQAELEAVGYPLEVIADGPKAYPRAERIEIVDRVGNTLRVEQRVVAVENMRFLDLEHEVGHVRQLLERFGTNPPCTERWLERPNGVLKKIDNATGLLSKKYDSIVEFHNRLQEYNRLADRGVPREILSEHANGVHHWYNEFRDAVDSPYSDKLNKWAIWANEHFPDIPELSSTYRDHGNLLIRERAR
ncbi:WXG100-like domain-containing protein [Nocardia australiensis]|uniref:WXG100-like domain-containing protein n=1 Tax=Nocardia australiensis TaxID=2887191 RepID=UPI001D147594|nr:hypothetical protein [Nocardia australiensis]